MKEIKNLIFVIIGSFFISLATVGFLNPNSIITGGGVGIAQLFHELFPFMTLGMWIAIVAIPLIALGGFYFGRGYILRTLFSIALISGFTDILKEFIKMPAFTQDTMLSSIFGGVFVGLGVGLVILGRSSTGGTTVVGEIIAMKSRFKTAEVLFFIDAVTMFCSIFVYGDLENSLYSVIGVYITTRIIDILLSGKPTKKAVNIVSNNPEVLAAKIYETLGEHGTILEGTNLKRTEKKTIILVVVDIAKLQVLKELLELHDPEAFFIVKEASEFHGRRFR